jgi:large subunit ribosomal protein L7/L12
MKEEYGIEPKTKILGVNVIPIPTLVADKTNFAVILKSVGTGSKLTLVKTVKEMVGNSLMEAKLLVDNAPSTLKENISKDEAIALEASLKEIGAEVEVL